VYDAYNGTPTQLGTKVAAELYYHMDGTAGDTATGYAVFHITAKFWNHTAYKPALTLRAEVPGKDTEEEHKFDVIKASDYVIEKNPGPEDVAEDPEPPP